MKKLSLYVFLVLMLASCSEYKVKKALENCADQKFSVAPSRSKDFDLRADLAKSGVYAILSGRVSRSQQKINEKEEEKTAALQQWRFQNPMPEMYKLSDVLVEVDPKKSLTEQSEHGNKIVNEYLMKMSKWREDLKFLEAVNENWIRAEKRRKYVAEAKMQRMKNDLADKKFKEMNFKQKSQMSLYVKLYGKCESEHKELPNQFLMKYQN